MRFPFDTTIDRDGEEIEVRVIYDVSPHIPARLYGDYPQPAEGGEVEIISITRAGKPFHTTQSEDAVIQNECEQRAGDDVENEASDAAEWRDQLARDDRLMSH
jgi:hypothetical protein